MYSVHKFIGSFVFCYMVTGPAQAQVNFFECARNPVACVSTGSQSPAPDGTASKQEAQQVQERLRQAQAEREALERERQALAEQLKIQQARVQALESEDRPKPPVSVLEPGRRLALVIGNARYDNAPLKNAFNDADDISRLLRQTGFTVMDVRDGTLAQMRAALRGFGDRLQSHDVGLVYYSGHGVEVKGRNYLVPINADIHREDEVVDQSLDVALVLEKMATAQKGVNILVLDACRDNPFGRGFRSSSRGLAMMDAPQGTLIAYSTAPGQVASDGDARERNSPYTKHLLRAMQLPNKPIEQVFKEVRRAVQQETGNRQTPWENTSLSGDFYFTIR